MARTNSFIGEFKSDLDLERLPSGKFDTNDCLLHLAAFAYNCLRLLGQLGLTGEIAPLRHLSQAPPDQACPERSRRNGACQEIMYRAAKFVAQSPAASCWTSGATWRRL
jgi:hypothetical protein